VEGFVCLVYLQLLAVLCHFFLTFNYSVKMVVVHNRFSIGKEKGS
jgi:hypothetical protein